MLRYLTHTKVQIFLFVLLLFILAGTGIFMHLESWTFEEAFYFTVATITTVGYGDLTPSTPASRVVASGYMMFTVPFLLIAIGVMAEAVFDMQKNGVTKSKKKKKKKK